jgi:hypothetical protein
VLLEINLKRLASILISGLFLASLWACNRAGSKPNNAFYYETVNTTTDRTGAKLGAYQVKAWFKGSARRIEVTQIFTTNPQASDSLYIVQNGKCYLIFLPSKRATVIQSNITPTIDAPGGAISMPLPPDLKWFAEFSKQGATLVGNDDIEGEGAERFELSKTFPTFSEKRTVWIGKKSGQLLRIRNENTSSNLTTTTEVKKTAAGEDYSDDLFVLPPDIILS